MINPDILSCTECPLSTLRKKVVPGQGPVPSRFMVIGEGPGPSENTTGRPFCVEAPAGSRLTTLLSRAGIDRDSVFITNVVACMPTDDGKEFRTPSAKEKKACKHWLDEQIEAVQPEMILALGDHAVKTFMPQASLMKVHGKAFKLSTGQTLVPLYHPSYYNRSSQATKLLVAQDYQNLLTTCDSLVVEPSIRWKLLQPDRISQVEHFCQYLLTKPRWATDIETTSLDPWLGRVLGISFSTGSETYYLDIRSLDDSEALKALAPFLKSDSIVKVIFNAKFEGKWFAIKTGDKDPLHNFEDPHLMAYLLGEPGGLKEGVLKNLGVQMTELGDLLGKGKKKIGVEDIPAEILAKYGSEDSYYTLMLSDCYYERFSETDKKVYHDIDLPLVMPLVRMECSGAPVDVVQVGALAGPMAEEISRLRRVISESLGWEPNLNATEDVRKLLFETLKLKSRKRTPKTKELSTDRDVIEGLRNGIQDGTIKAEAKALPVLEELLEYKTLFKLSSTYANNLRPHPTTGVVHTEFKQTSTITGRLSSGTGKGGLNLQNIPIRTDLGRRMRRAFIAPEGWLFLKADASQEELRILAHFSQDRNLMLAYNTGVDVHEYGARNFVAPYTPHLDKKEQRNIAKSLHFGIIYGLQATGVATLLGCSRSEGQAIIDQIYATYPGIRVYERLVERQLAEFGYVTDLFGRKMPILSYFSSSRRDKSKAVELARNYKIQGTAGSIIRRATAIVDRFLLESDLESKIHIQVHDELDMLVRPSEIHLIAPVVSKALAPDILRVPMVTEVEVGLNWVDLQPYDRNKDYVEVEKLLRQEASSV